MISCVRTLLFATAAAVLAGPAGAQEAPPLSLLPDQPGWDAPRALELIALARERRLLPQQDTTLQNYSARAEGFVYFYLDRRDTDERTLVKVDQVALEVFWSPPDRTKQRIVGLRDVSRLPNRMHYHLDHLTVVQDGFGDVIRMGDGDEVGDVPHPAAPGSDSIYQFRLADSLTLRLPGTPEPIRVYELQVRPRRLDRSALVGSVFVDRARGDIVRMTFTFTPASYVDRRLDYISVSLDNGLWEGRYWLPNEQTLQIRRQVPELDFTAGAVIHGRMRISDYVFNDTLPPSTFYGYPVVAVPPGQRRSFDFERDIYADLNDAGLAPPPDLAHVRQQAAALLGTSRLSGLPAWRLNIESASSAFRYNRVEGAAVGVGAAYVPGPVWRADVTAGYAFGAERPWGAVGARRALPRGDATLRLELRQPRDLGVAPAFPTAVNTLAALFFGEDQLDPYFVSGPRLSLRQALGRGLQAELTLAAERHRAGALARETAPFSGSSRFRPVRGIDEGDAGVATLRLRRAAPDPGAFAWSGSLELESGVFGGRGWLRPLLELETRLATTAHDRTLLVTASVGGVTAGAPSQRLFVLGGQGTLPGHDFRGFAGRRYALLQAEARQAVLGPWLGLRLIGAAGAAGGVRPPIEPGAPRTWICTSARCAWTGWGVGPTHGVRASAGAGASLFWDLLRVDAVRGLDDGRWQFLLSFHREFRDMS